MVVGIDPKVDYAFKWSFGREEKKPLLIGLLQAVLNLPASERIVEIEILNPFTTKVAPNDKLSVLDIRARDQLGRLHNVEMQMLGYLALLQRLLYYWSKTYTEQLQAGQDYDQLRPTILVCFINDVIFPDIKDYHSCFQLVDKGHGAILTDDLQIHVLELPKFTKTPRELVTGLDRWLYFLKHGQDLDPAELPGEIDSPEIRQAMEGLMELAQTDIEKMIYDGRVKARRDDRAMRRQYEAAAAKATAAEAKAAQAEAAATHAEAAAAQAEAAAAQAAEKGQLIGTILTLQRVLGQQPTSPDDLTSMSVGELARLSKEMFARLPAR